MSTSSANPDPVHLNNNDEDKDKTTITKSATRPVPSWRDVAAGASAGAFSRTVTAPIERIKLLIQLQHSLDKPESILKKGGVQPSLLSTTSTRTATNTSAWQVAASIYEHEGLLSFWRGNLPSVLRVSGTAAINFTMMNYYKEAAVRPLLQSQYLFFGTATKSPEQMERRRKNITSLVAGGMAGGTATTLLYPIEFLRTRLAADVARGKQTGTYKFQGMGHALRTIVRSDGIRGLFQGYGIALFGGIFYRVLFLGGYDVLKSEAERANQLQSRRDNGTGNDTDSPGLTWGQRFGIAQTVSLTAGTISYPLDSVRRRLMMQAGKPHTERTYRNSIQCIRLVFANEGIRGFFLGIGPNVLRSVSGALLLVAYVAFKVAI